MIDLLKVSAVARFMVVCCSCGGWMARGSRKCRDKDVVAVVEGPVIITLQKRTF